MHKSMALEIIRSSPLLSKYINSVGTANKSTAIEYEYRLSKFGRYLSTTYGLTIDEAVNKLLRRRTTKEVDAYDILSGYVAYLRDEERIQNPNTIRTWIITARTFLEYHDVDISPRKFKLKVRLPKKIVRQKEAISKEEIREILSKCADIKLKTYVTLLAATGMRATEALMLRNKDFDFESDPPIVRVRGEFTKTRTDRYVYLTKVVVAQCKAWIDFKYRRRRIVRVVNGKVVSQWIEPKPDPNDVFFSTARKKQQNLQEQLKGPSSSITPKGLYVYISEEFAKTLDRIGFGDREDYSNNNNSLNNARRKITLHSFRRFVKSTISDLGYADFSEWFIGHAGSTYYRKKDREREEIFKKIEPYLTFMDFSQLEAKGADIESKLEQKDDQLRAVQEQVGTLFQLMAIEDAEERQRKLVDAAKLWIDKGMYRA
jgi:integrase